MKKLVLSLVGLCATTIAFAGIVVTKNDGNIEDVSNIVVSNTAVSYVENGDNKSLPIDQVSAVLYDNGRYEEVKAMPQSIVQPAQETTSNGMTQSQQTSYFGNSATVTTSQPIDDSDWRKEFAKDWRAFVLAGTHKDEVRIVVKAINTIVFRRGIFNHGGAISVDKSALDAYIAAKKRGASGEDAVRERNAVYVSVANQILESRQKK